MKIGLMGLGTVGQAVLEGLRENRERIESRAGGPVEVKRALILHPEKHEEHGGLITTDPREILDDPEIAIVVEVMGGFEPARTYMMGALKRGKAVVTANKEVLARAGEELFQASEQGGADLLFEASVGAGVPIIRAIKMGLAANQVSQLLGIVNGTTNFILSKMDEDGADYEEALQEAQASGYAEADPTADVDGFDAARKAAILASIAFGSRVTEGQVFREGIRGLSAEDIRRGRRFGWVLKLLALAREREGRLEVRVHPTFLPQEHPLAAVKGIYNAVLVEAVPLGDAMFYGPGAGGPSTASAVLGDIIEAARNLRLGGRAVSCTCYRELRHVPPSESAFSFFLRLTVADRPGVLAQVAGILGRHQVSIRSVIQEEGEGGKAELVLVTHRSSEGSLGEAVGELSRLSVVASIARPIRILEMDH